MLVTKEDNPFAWFGHLLSLRLWLDSSIGHNQPLTRNVQSRAHFCEWMPARALAGLTLLTGKERE